MDSYNYPKLIASACRALPEVQDRLLVKFLVQIVDPEYNAATLVFEGCAYSICGRVGSEILGIEAVEEIPIESEGEGIATRRYEPFAQFEGRRLLEARQIGEAWNGHGFEFTFEGLPYRSMLIQSIYTNPKPEEQEDCLRLGVGHYSCGLDDAV